MVDQLNKLAIISLAKDLQLLFPVLSETELIEAAKVEFKIEYTIINNTRSCWYEVVFNHRVSARVRECINQRFQGNSYNEFKSHGWEDLADNYCKVFIERII